MLSPTVPLSSVPPWLLGELGADMLLLEQKKERSIDRFQVTRYLEEHYSVFIQIYTDASKTENNRVGAAFIIPELNVMLNKRVSDHLSVFTGELLAILLALEWVENNKPSKVLIGSDSSSAVTRVKNMQSEARQDIMLEITQTVYRINKVGVIVKSIWIPAHIGGDGNELADKYAKSATKKSEVNMAVNYSKAEVKNIIKEVAGGVEYGNERENVLQYPEEGRRNERK